LELSQNIKNQKTDKQDEDKIRVKLKGIIIIGKK